MPLPAHLSVTLRWGLAFDEHDCVLYYTKESGDALDATNIDQLADEFWAAFSTKCREVINPDCRFLGTRVRWLSGTEDLEGLSTEAPVLGTAVSDDVEPEEVAVVIQRRTGKPGRNKRGRIFVPLVPSDFLDGSAIIVANRDPYMALATEMAQTQVFSGVPGTWVPVQPDWKNSLLEPVQQVRLDTEVKSRRDRRDPKRSIVISAMV
jgi:hypothetical protein